jgi:hypothetical protein
MTLATSMFGCMSTDCALTFELQWQVDPVLAVRPCAMLRPPYDAPTV